MCKEYICKIPGEKKKTFEFAWPAVFYTLLVKRKLTVKQAERFMALFTDSPLDSWKEERPNFSAAIKKCLKEGNYGVFKDKTLRWRAYLKLNPKINHMAVTQILPYVFY